MLIVMEVWMPSGHPGGPGLVGLVGLPEDGEEKAWRQGCVGRRPLCEANMDLS